MKKLSMKEALSSQVKDKRIIGFMVLKGFGTFFIVTGLVGLSLLLGPLNLIIKFEYTTIFGNMVFDVILCLLFCVFGGALEFFASAFINYLSTEEK